MMIFATVGAVACVRGDPETFSWDLRIVTRSVLDLKKCNLFGTYRETNKVPI